MESIILSLALGLTIDFVIHFSVAYLLSRESTREGKVRDVLGLVGSPTTMAAVTTFVTGVGMSPAKAKSYFQMSVFLMAIMVISLVYSVFFFLSLCRFIGPLNNCGQIPWPCLKKDDDAPTSRETTYAQNSGGIDNPANTISSEPSYQASTGFDPEQISNFNQSSEYLQGNASKTKGRPIMPNQVRASKRLTINTEGPHYVNIAALSAEMRRNASSVIR